VAPTARRRRPAASRRPPAPAAVDGPRCHLG
jgi:hypothetical protein